MPCTTILVGKRATFDGSTMIARNSDSGSGKFTPKKKTVVLPSEIGDTYTSMLSHVTIALPKNPMKYTALPNVLPNDGIWAGSGVNQANVGMVFSPFRQSFSNAISRLSRSRCRVSRCCCPRSADLSSSVWSSPIICFREKSSSR